jgi:hypothetical protein
MGNVQTLAEIRISRKIVWTSMAGWIDSFVSVSNRDEFFRVGTSCRKFTQCLPELSEFPLQNFKQL